MKGKTINHCFSYEIDILYHFIAFVRKNGSLTTLFHILDIKDLKRKIEDHMKETSKVGEKLVFSFD